MEVILLGIYGFFVWLIFYKFKWLPMNFIAAVITITLPIVAMMALFLLLNISAPATDDVRAMNYVIPIVPRITGQVTEVPIQPNRPIKKGDVLFKIDPVPFEAAVKAAEATLRGLQDQLKNTAAKKAALTPRIDLAKKRVEQFSALAATGAGKRADLEGCVHVAPSNGRVANLSLQPGVRATQFATMPVMSFIQEDDPWLLAFYRQNELRYVEPGDEAEIFMKVYPGRIIKCKVDSILWATAQGQMPINGNLPNTMPVSAPEQRIAVRLLTEGKDKDVFLAAGARGGGAIYTNDITAIQILRRVIVRITAKFDWFVIKHLSALFGGH